MTQEEQMYCEIGRMHMEVKLLRQLLTAQGDAMKRMQEEFANDRKGGMAGIQGNADVPDDQGSAAGKSRTAPQ